MQKSNHHADSTFSEKTDSEHKELGWRESVCIKSPSRAFTSTNKPVGPADTEKRNPSKPSVPAALTEKGPHGRRGFRKPPGGARSPRRPANTVAKKMQTAGLHTAGLQTEARGARQLRAAARLLSRLAATQPLAPRYTSIKNLSVPVSALHVCSCSSNHTLLHTISIYQLHTASCNLYLHPALYNLYLATTHCTLEHCKLRLHHWILDCNIAT